MASYTYTLPATISRSGYAAEMRITQTPDDEQLKSSVSLSIWAKSLTGGFGDPFYVGGNGAAASFELNGTVIDTIPAMSAGTYRLNIPSPNVFYQLRQGSVPKEWLPEISHSPDGTASAAIRLALRFYNDGAHYFDATWDGTVQLHEIDAGNAYIGEARADAYIFDGAVWRPADGYIYDRGEWRK